MKYVGRQLFHTSFCKFWGESVCTMGDAFFEEEFFSRKQQSLSSEPEIVNKFKIFHMVDFLRSRKSAVNSKNYFKNFRQLCEAVSYFSIVPGTIIFIRFFEFSNFRANEKIFCKNFVNFWSNGNLKYGLNGVLLELAFELDS